MENTTVTKAAFVAVMFAQKHTHTQHTKVQQFRLLTIPAAFKLSIRSLDWGKVVWAPSTLSNQ